MKPMYGIEGSLGLFLVLQAWALSMVRSQRRWGAPCCGALYRSCELADAAAWCGSGDSSSSRRMDGCRCEGAWWLEIFFFSGQIRRLRQLQGHGLACGGWPRWCLTAGGGWWCLVAAGGRCGGRLGMWWLASVVAAVLRSIVVAGLRRDCLYKFGLFWFWLHVCVWRLHGMR